ncbi:MAG TPA: carboxypeptidase regulatory-like domain-containing protein [Terriglobia bacterium]|nr:carboxypeptidase regulatory-like domain-containing protein [Terriglobia bacterium]
MSWKWLPLILLLAQTPPRPADKASIQGFVLRMGTADPVSKAVVTLTRTDSRRESYSATTASGGQFAFQNLEPGQYRLSAARNGYVRSEFGARSPNRPGLPITLSPGQKLNELTIGLMPAGTIAGRIFDRDGEPLANVNIQALRYTYQDGQRVLNQVQGARTNDLGEYRLFWLQPGQYFVSATYAGGPVGQRGAAVAAIVDALGAAGIGGRGGRGGAGAIAAIEAQNSNSSDTEDEGYIPVYYPGTTDAQSATAINLPSGVVFSGVDLTLTPVRTLRVRGQVINGTTGQPARNANITLIPRGRVGLGANLLQNFRNRNINDQGVFEIRGVVPGSYDLVGFINDRSAVLSGRVALEMGGADAQNVSLVVSPGYPLAGRLTIDGRTTAPGTNPDTARIRVMLRPSAGGGFQQFRGGQNAVQVQADGTFTLPSLGQDNYRLNVAGLPRNSYVRSARLGSTDVLNEGLQIDRQPNGVLDIAIGTDAGTADGMVANDKQEASVNVPVVLVPDPTRRNRSDLYRNVSTDATGHFHIEGVPPGDYKLFAWEDVENGAWQDPDFIRQYEDRGKTVRIGPSGTAMTELRVIPPQI